LVFSAWPEALLQLGLLLSRAQIKYTGGSTGLISTGGSLSKKIDNFRADASISVLLLNAVKQSTGLTLTVANQIFLLDPIDQANELQAIGRAYRIGQLQQTVIRRFEVEQGPTPMSIEKEGN